jgi:hypothetical protein
MAESRGYPALGAGCPLTPETSPARGEGRENFHSAAAAGEPTVATLAKAPRYDNDLHEACSAKLNMMKGNFWSVQAPQTLQQFNCDHIVSCAL